MFGHACCSPSYNQLNDPTESRCCNFKSVKEKETERALEPHEVPHFASMRAPRKVQFLMGIALFVYGFLLVFAPEFMAYNLFLGREYMQDEGFLTTADQHHQQEQAQMHLEQLQIEEELATEETEASDSLVMNILESILGPGVNPSRQQRLVAEQAAREAELQLRHLEQMHEEIVNEQRAKGAASIPFQQFSRLYGAVVLAVAIHGLCTTTLRYHVNCSMALLYIGFYGTQAIALLIAVMPVVKVNNAVTTIISSSWLLTALMVLSAAFCAYWIWLYQRLRVAEPYVANIIATMEDKAPGASI